MNKNFIKKLLITCFLGLVPFYGIVASDGKLSKNVKFGGSLPAGNYSDKLQMELKGHHYFKYHAPICNGHENYNTLIKAPKWINEISLKLNKDNIELFSEWEFRNYLQEGEDWEALTDIRIKENYIKLMEEKVAFTFGFQKFTWGVADDFNPTNNLNPKDYEIDGYDLEDIPIMAASIKYYPSEAWSLEGVYIPYEQNDEYFWEYSDMVPGQIFNQYKLGTIDFDTQPDAITSIEGIKRIETKNLTFSPKSSIVGFKTSYYSSAVDFSLSYVYDVDPFFTPRMQLEQYNIGVEYDYLNSGRTFNSIENQIAVGSNAYRVSDVILKRNRVHRFGMDIKKIIGKYGIWVEACYSLVKKSGDISYQNRKSDLSFVAGLDFFYGPNDRFYVNLQYTGKWIPNYYKNFYTDYQFGRPDLDKLGDKNYMDEYFHRMLVPSMGFQNEEYMHGIMTTFDFAFFDNNLKPGIDAYFNLPSGYDKEQKKRYGSLMLLPEIEYNAGNSLFFSVGAKLAYSWYKPQGSLKRKNDDPADLVGALKPFNNIFFKVSYKWNYKTK